MAADVELPATNLQRAFLFAGLAAVAGSLVWGAIVYFAHAEHGLIAWGIGGLVGFACVFGGGHGRNAALLAGALALASIASGKLFAYQLTLGAVADDVTAGMTVSAHAERGEDSRLWHELGPTPTDEQVREFIRDRGFEDVEPDVFVAEQGVWLTQFHEQQPSLAEWRGSVREQIAAGFSFGTYLTDDFHPLDVVFALLGIGTAFGLVERKTAEMQAAVLAESRRKAERDEALAKHAAAKAAAQGEPGADQPEAGDADAGDR